jgi:hypothetical protein
MAIIGRQSTTRSRGRGQSNKVSPSSTITKTNGRLADHLLPIHDGQVLVKRANRGRRERNRNGAERAGSEACAVSVGLAERRSGRHAGDQAPSDLRQAIETLRESNLVVV